MAIEAMQNSMPRGRRIIIQVTGTLLFVAVILTVSNCHAQTRRGLFRRGARVQQQALPPAKRVNQDQFEASSSVGPYRRFPAASRYFNPSNMQSWDPGSGNQRYIGGFHYTHFQNIGIPSGDIGLRGNAYHWRPW